ncbi:MAG: toprim domain-containing protein, partial [Legionella sp.]
IETALALHAAIQIPVWATVSATGMESIIIPDDVTEVIIAIDKDANGRGQIAGSKLSKRLLSEGRIVTRLMPSTVGYDFADLLVEENQ